MSWKKPSNYTGDESYYEPSWLIAENLDQNSLAAAFRQFPMDGDPDRSSKTQDSELKTDVDEEDQAGHFDIVEDDDFSDDEEEDEESEGEEDATSDDMQEYEEDDEGKTTTKTVKDPDVSHLEDSGKFLHLHVCYVHTSLHWHAFINSFVSLVLCPDYDSPGTVELVLNRRTYRVGQSYFSGPEENIIYTISMIQPIPRKAKCYKYMRMEKSFVCPKGKEDIYVLLDEDVVLELSLLKMPCKAGFKKFEMRYEQEDENQRSFAYYNETGKILHHPTGRPAVCK